MTTPPGGRARWVSLGLLAATFVVGALSGAAVDRVLVSAPADDGPSSSRTERERERDDDDRDRRPRYVIHQVQMTADQRTSIDSILDFWSDELRARRSEEREQWGQIVRTLTDSTLVSIKSVLSAEQQAEYDRLLEERRKEFMERRRDDEDRDRDGSDRQPADTTNGGG